MLNVPLVKLSIAIEQISTVAGVSGVCFTKRLVNDKVRHVESREGRITVIKNCCT